MDVKINVKGLNTKKLTEFINFQGELKKLDKTSLEKLKESIKRNGFNAPIFIWKDKNYILDGHQRIQAINALTGEGYALPDNSLPYVEIEAENETQAAEMVLTYNSQYGEIDLDGLNDFIEEYKIEKLELPEYTINYDKLLSTDYEDEDELKEEVRVPFNDERDTLPIKELYKLYDKVLVNFSGGKDSILTLLNTLDVTEKEKITAVYVATPFDFPDMEDYIKYILQDVFRVDYIILNSGLKNWEVKLKKYGFPSRMNKWCNSYFKVKALNKLHNKLSDEKIKFITAIGTRAQESKRRSKMLMRGRWGKTDYIFPIFDIKTDELVDTINQNKIKMFHSYKVFNRCSCYVCPEASCKYYTTLKKHYPELYQKGLGYLIKGLNSEKYRSGGMFIDTLKNMVFDKKDDSNILKFEYFYSPKNKKE